jgi:hypothetical protein
MLRCGEGGVDGVVIEKLTLVGAAGEAGGAPEAIPGFPIASKAPGLTEFPERIPGALHIGDGLPQGGQGAFRGLLQEGVEGERGGRGLQRFAEGLARGAEARFVDGIVGEAIRGSQRQGRGWKMGTTFAGMVTRWR